MANEFICRADWPVVTTDKGQLRGFFFNGVFHFRGIKYADAERFQAPRPVERWDGIRDALEYGLNCVGPDGVRDRQPVGELFTPHRYWPESEHCQYLNVFTSSIDPNAKKAVMVWLHGGGYLDGSAIEMTCYDGTNLAKNEDIVCVTLNHRLNVLGFLDVSEYGPQYKNSVNAGMADIVAALQWIQENIAAFGGDPENVTIFGQSGGGGKVSALEQIPAAEGLFHKAIVMSGAIPDDDGLVYTDAPSKKIAEAIMEELGSADHDFQILLEAPAVVLERATARAQNNLKKQGYSIGWGPQKNGWYEGYVVYNGVSEHSKKIPTIFGTEICEFGYNPFSDPNSVSETDRRSAIIERFGEDKGRRLIELYEKAYPGVNILNVFSLDMLFRPATKEMIRRRVQECSAPTYCYMMTLEFPYLSGKRAWHCADIPFAFGNAAEIGLYNIPNGITEKVQEQFCKAFTSFAKTGDPNHGKIPTWKPCDSEHLYTMLFDNDAVLRTDFDDKLIDYYKSITPEFKMKFPATENDKKRWLW